MAPWPRRKRSWMRRLPLDVAARPAVLKQRRWWLFALGAVGGIMLLATAALLTLLGYCTSRQPMPLPTADITQADREALIERWGEFQPKVAKGLPAAPFTASAKDLNVFFSLMPRYRDCICFSAEGSTLRADVSMPLDRVLPVIGRGRYVNATDTFRIGLGADGFPRVEILSAHVNGRPLPRGVERLDGERVSGGRERGTAQVHGPDSRPSFGDPACP